ncbi:Phosphatidate cytidylyltransferase [Rhynchospora pubera]|uniref:Phosphatidate cytidylyltransferase n=1 Tax=Rhynchospora pubera TaxID=906938 RepID=A0AAV8DS69_9POAL|nr:Phosphatidate cytidylyltransferase [Rhynchospora pubera]
MAVAAAHCSCSCSRSRSRSLQSLSLTKRGALTKRVSMWPSPAPRSVKSVHRLLRHLPLRSSAADSAFFPSSSSSSSSIAEKYTSATENSPTSMASPLEGTGDEISSADISISEIPLEQNQKGGSNQLKKRVLFGLGIGFVAGGVVVAGGWVFTSAMAAVVLTGSREFFGLVRSRRIADGMAPPPRYVSRVCSVICSLMPIFTLYYGHMDVSVTFSAFIIAVAVMLQRGNPRFAHMASAVFGLFYCGYLPSFWIKLRCGLAAPALNTEIGKYWPVLLGGRAHWTVGLVATLISISSIIAADSFAFLGGRAFGKTPLTSISPKKTLEGAFAGLLGCVVVTVLLSKILCWPNSLLSALAYGVLNFAGSIFGDLLESLIKRDAGVKDSGSLIPGHGGILDRVDSYVFTGALSYSFVKVVLPLFGL